MQKQTITHHSWYNDAPSTVPPSKGHPFTGVTLTHQNTKTAAKLISSALPGAFQILLWWNIQSFTARARRRVWPLWRTGP